MQRLAVLVALLPALAAASSACVNLACAPSNIEADIVFLIDNSNGNADYFQTVIQFLSDFTKALTISPTMAQVGLYTYALRATSSGTLSSLSTPQAIADAISKLPYAGDDVTDKQLVQALSLQDQEVTAANGLRSGIPHILIVLATDQWTGPDPLTSTQLTAARQKYDFILAIGLGPSAIENNFGGMRDLTGNFADVFYAYSYDQLQFAQPWIWYQACPGSHVPTSATPATVVPTQNPQVPCQLSSLVADVFIIVDTSTSISSSEYANLKAAILDFVSVFSVGDGKTQFAVVTASIDSELYYTGFHSGQTRAQILSVLSSLTQDDSKGQTLKLALQAIQGAYLSQNYDTPIKNVVYFSGTTDFDSDPNDLAASLAQQYSVTFQAVRVKSTADASKLASFTGGAACVYDATSQPLSGVGVFLQTNLCNKKSCR